LFILRDLFLGNCGNLHNPLYTEIFHQTMYNNNW